MSLCPLQGPSQQRPLPAPGLPEAAPISEHARGRPLGEQASAGLRGRWAAAFREPVTPVAIDATAKDTALDGNDLVTNKSSVTVHVSV